MKCNCKTTIKKIKDSVAARNKEYLIALSKGLAENNALKYDVLLEVNELLKDLDKCNCTDGQSITEMSRTIQAVLKNYKQIELEYSLTAAKSAIIKAFSDIMFILNRRS